MAGAPRRRRPAAGRSLWGIRRRPAGQQQPRVRLRGPPLSAPAGPHDAPGDIPTHWRKRDPAAFTWTASPAGPPRLHAMENPQQIARMQFVYGDHDEELRALLDESFAPRPPDFLFDLAMPLLTPHSRLLDIGCRDARHLIPLVARSGCIGVGIDPIDRNLERARAAVTAADLDQRIEIRQRQVRLVGSLASLARLPPAREVGARRLRPPPALASGVIPEHWRTATQTPRANLVRRRLDFVAPPLLPAIRRPDRCVERTTHLWVTAGHMLCGARLTWCAAARARARARARRARARARAPAADHRCGARRARRTKPPRRRRRRRDVRPSRRRPPACRACGPAPGRGGARAAARARRRPARSARRVPRPTRGSCSCPPSARPRVPAAERKSAVRRRGGCRRSGPSAGAC